MHFLITILDLGWLPDPQHCQKKLTADAKYNQYEFSLD